MTTHIMSPMFCNSSSRGFSGAAVEELDALIGNTTAEVEHASHYPDAAFSCDCQAIAKCHPPSVSTSGSEDMPVTISCRHHPHQDAADCDDQKTATCITTCAHSRYYSGKDNVVVDDDDDHKDARTPPAQKLSTQSSSKEMIPLQIVNMTNQERISMQVVATVAIRDIIISLIRKKRISNDQKYVLIDTTNKIILNPQRRLSDYPQVIADAASVLVLYTESNLFASPTSEKTTVPELEGTASIQDTSNTMKTTPIQSVTEQTVSTTASPKAAKKMSITFVCSFGAPYNSQKVHATYHPELSLDDYAKKIKRFFHLNQEARISFYVQGKEYIGIWRKLPVEKMSNITANSSILVETSGIIVSIKQVLHAKKKMVCMFRRFTHEMLLNEISAKLGLPQQDINALIVFPWQIIDSDERCREIHEYDTIHVLTKCQCCAAGFMHVLKNMPRTPAVQYDHMRQHSHVQLQHEQEYEQYVPVPVPIRLDLMYAAARPLHQNFKTTDLLYQRTQSRPARPLHPTILRRVPVPQEPPLVFTPPPHPPPAPKRKRRPRVRNRGELCRWGNDCRYFRQQEKFGRCRYYHPTSQKKRRRSKNQFADYKW